jgi:GNAT superfamily N-acetyltransferase
MLIIKRIDELHPAELYMLKDIILEYGRFMYDDLKLIAGKGSFSKEMGSFPGSKYTAPDGTFFLALYNGEPAGCIGLRRFDEASCEMKRMFVRPAFRGKNIGMQMCRVFFEAAKEFAYSRVLLDTNKEMPEAIALYLKLGFSEIPAYCENENLHPLYFEKLL